MTAAAKPVTARQARKAVTAYESAYVAIADLTRALRESPDGETARKAGDIAYTAEFLFRRLHELHDGLERRERG